MFTVLPLSEDKDITIDTESKNPIRIVTFGVSRNAYISLTREEAKGLIELLLLNGQQILQDLEHPKEGA